MRVNAQKRRVADTKLHTAHRTKRLERIRQTGDKPHTDNIGVIPAARIARHITAKPRPERERSV